MSFSNANTGLLHAGDVIHEINGTAVRGFSVDQVADLMAGLRGTVVFKITSALSDLRPRRKTQVRGCSLAKRTLPFLIIIIQ